MRASSTVLIGHALVAIQVAAVAQTDGVNSPRTTLSKPRTPLLAPTAAPTRASLQERQWLCHLFGNCRTTSAVEDDQPAQNPKATANVPATSTSVAVSITSTTTSTTPRSTSTTTSSSSSTTSTTMSSSVMSSSSSSTSSTTTTSSSTTSSTESSSTTTSFATSSSPTSSATSLVTVTSIMTGSDGSQSTSVSASSTAVAVPVQKNSSGGGLSGKTWGIIGGVIGGVAALLVGLFVIWRLMKRRSSNRAMDEIAWPELENDATGGGFSVLNPPGTRKTGGAGFEMEKDRDGSAAGGDYYDDDDDDAGEIRNGGWAAGAGAASPRLGYDPRSSEQFYSSGGGQYGYAPDYGQSSRNYYDLYHQEAPLPPLPPTGTLSGRNSPGLAAPSSPQPGLGLPYPGSPIHSSEMVDSAYPPRSSRIHSSSAGLAGPELEDPYGGYAGMSTDDVPLTAAAQHPAGSGIPYVGGGGGSAGGGLYSPAR
ncbi:hypothetical protein JCM3774_002048 [Rhodotorula dairenensis]